MMINSTLHGSGHGSRLLAWCEARIRASGHSVARLETFAANVQAVRFYRKHGWAEASRDNDDGGRLRRSYFAKKLS